MNGNIMTTSTKFVYVSHDYRRGWDNWIKGNVRRDQYTWPDFDKEFKEKYWDARHREEFMIQNCHRPKSSYINDALGENQFLFNMSNMTEHYPVIDYQYYPEVENVDFNDLMMKRALEISKTNKMIDILYSGGIDSTAMVLALREVCPRDQLNIIAGGTSVMGHYQKLWDEYVVKGPYVLDESGNLYGQVDPSKNVYTSGCEADRLFGSVGYPPAMDDAVRDPDSPLGWKVNKKKPPNLEEDIEWNYDMWWTITRYTFITQSFRLLQNITCDKIDLKNYQPFFRDADIHKWAINQHYNRNMHWYSHGPRSPVEQFMNAKMMLRDFIAQWDKDYAYNKGKTRLMEQAAQKEFFSPLPNDFNVKAITDDGTIVTKHNILDYLHTGCLII